MRDSTKTLKFNPNRDLGFEPSRGVDFEVRRSLSFDKSRDLLFNVDRDLEIRKRGVVFRGYVCPICGASVADDDPRCDECGVEFIQSEAKAKKQKPKAPEKKRSRPTGRRKRTSKSKRSKKKSRGTRKTFQCPVCGHGMYVGTKQCPSCNIEF